MKINFISNQKIGWILIIMFIILLLPMIFTLPAIAGFLDFSKTGEIGDTIGGITSPFFNGLAALLVYLAFMEQVKANNRNNEDKTNVLFLTELRDLRTDFDKMMVLRNNLNIENQDSIYYSTVFKLLGYAMNISSRYIFMINLMPKKRDNQNEAIVMQYKYQWSFLHKTELFEIKDILLANLNSGDFDSEGRTGLESCIKSIETVDKIIQGVLV